MKSSDVMESAAQPERIILLAELEHDCKFYTIVKQV